MTIHPQFTFNETGEATGVFLNMQDWQALLHENNKELKQHSNGFVLQKSKPAQIVCWGEYPINAEGELVRSFM